MSALVADASSAVLGSPLAYSDDALAKILSARHFVDVRTTVGGPAPAQTAAAIAAGRDALRSDQMWSKSTAEGLIGAEQRLAERRAAL
jgi:hypothetical protein